jgi:hypothetical protein
VLKEVVTGAILLAVGGAGTWVISQEQANADARVAVIQSKLDTANEYLTKEDFKIFKDEFGQYWVYMVNRLDTIERMVSNNNKPIKDNN